MAQKDRKFDNRTIEAYLRDGVVSREDYAQHLEELPDVSAKAEKMEAQFVEGILDEDQEKEQESEDESGEEE